MMKYVGMLYGKVGGKYIPLDQKVTETSEVVDGKKLKVILKRSCPPHRKDILKPCTLMIDCAKCREAYLQKGQR